MLSRTHEKPSLPIPTRPRGQPLRLGLVEIFHYDSEEFWFRDGHLLLRGNNGTGKSKVLSLTLPFLLDAQIKPSRIADISDGTSTTLLLGVKRANRVILGQPHPGDDIGYTSGWDYNTVRRTNIEPRPDYSGDGEGKKRFGSAHTGGFNVSFADGSVRLISYAINVTTFAPGPRRPRGGGRGRKGRRVES